MTAAWFAPLIVLAVGAVAAMVYLRRIVEANDDLAGSQRRFNRLEQVLIPVRVETRRTRESLDRFDRR